MQEIRCKNLPENQLYWSLRITPDLQEFLRTILCSEYEVHKAINGADALNRLSNLQPDIVISDVMMPEMDGIEFLKRVKANSNICHIPLFYYQPSLIERSDSGIGVWCGRIYYQTFQFHLSESESRLPVQTAANAI